MKISLKHGLGYVLGMFVGLSVGLLPIAKLALQLGNSYYRTQYIDASWNFGTCEAELKKEMTTHSRYKRCRGGAHGRETLVPIIHEHSFREFDFQ